MMITKQIKNLQFLECKYNKQYYLQHKYRNINNGLETAKTY